MTVLDEADEAVETVTKHKSVTALIITILVLYSFGLNFWHLQDINHPGFALAQDFAEIEKKMVTKDELNSRLEPITESLLALTCNSAEVQLDLARKDVTSYLLIETRTFEQNKQLIKARDRVTDMEARRDRACKNI